MHSTTNFTPHINDRPSVFPQDGRGSPSDMGVRSAHTATRNLRTRPLAGEVAGLAPVNEFLHTMRPQRPNQNLDPNDEPNYDTTQTRINDIHETIIREQNTVDNQHETQREAQSQPETYTATTNERRRVRPSHTAGKTIASRNIRGRTRKDDDGKRYDDKPRKLVQWMQQNKIDIMAIQDTHWDNEYAEKVASTLPNHLLFYSHESTTKGGVAFILDTRSEKPKKAELTTLIQGRATCLTVDYEYQTLNIVNVYFPSHHPAERTAFIGVLKTTLRRLLPLPSLILLGDFNMTEGECDRSPPRPEESDSLTALLELKSEFDLVDGWRTTNEHALQFTYKQYNGSDRNPIFSRIDRIYVSENILERSNEWEIFETAHTESDHGTISVKILEEDAPSKGPGEWHLDPKIITYPGFKQLAEAALVELEAKLKYYETSLNKAHGNEHKIRNLRRRTNPQLIWAHYKAKIKSAGIKTANKRRRKIAAETNAANNAITKALKNLEYAFTDEEKLQCRHALMEAKENLSQKLQENRKMADLHAAAKWWKTNERGTKEWYALGKEQQTSNSLRSLRRDQNSLETSDTKEILEIAKDFYKNLQSAPEETDEKTEATYEVLRNIKVSLTNQEKEMFSKSLNPDHLTTAIKDSAAGKAPGPDGIPNEFWKQELEWHVESLKTKKKRPNIANLMTKYLRDVEEQGPLDIAFAEGRITLIHKKKDRRDIGNYRPITLLNTDYKLYTTVIAKNLQKVCSKLINTDQAGFMTGRNIMDQTKTIEFTIELCEQEGIDGLIIALDQEKAYDRIDHEYFWDVLASFGFPPVFIKRLKMILRAATTKIKINGHLSEKFKVERGMRQGDPMSCLLYNLAIEPLLEAIRRSPLSTLR